MAVLRWAKPQDVSALLDLYQHLIPEAVPPEVEPAQELLAQLELYPGSGVVVAELDGVLAASCSLVVIPNLARTGRPFGLIENVVTHAEHRKRGLGTRVLETAVARAWAWDCYKVMLLTGTRKPETLRFYQQAGFEQTKTGFEIRQIPVRPQT